MQEVFENIIKKLENLGWVFADYYPDGTNISRVSKKSVPYDEVVNIFKQTAAEYNNGWITCSSGKLPEEHEDVEVTVEEMADEVGGKRYYTIRSWIQDGQWVIKKNPYNPTVIAWKYPTEPYQPK